MVVNQKTRVPGRGANSYFRRFCAHFLDRDVNPDQLRIPDKRALIDRAQEEIFDFPSWGEVLEACGLAETKAPRSRPKRRRLGDLGGKRDPKARRTRV